jgi:hypothetical protein
MNEAGDMAMKTTGRRLLAKKRDIPGSVEPSNGRIGFAPGGHVDDSRTGLVDDMFPSHTALLWWPRYRIQYLAGPRLHNAVTTAHVTDLVSGPKLRGGSEGEKVTRNVGASRITLT